MKPFLRKIVIFVFFSVNEEYLALAVLHHWHEIPRVGTHLVPILYKFCILPFINKL